MAHQVSLFNIITATDSYKVSHAPQYPKGTKNVYSYFECRGFPELWSNETVMVGLQPMLDAIAGVAFTMKDILDAEEFFKDHFGNENLFNKRGWVRMLEKHGGKLPLRICAVEEGTVVPTSNALITVETTDPEFFWLTNYIETFLVQVWYPITVATQSREMKKILKKSLELTGDVAGLPFKLHDFGFRGVTGFEQAGIGGMAHLVNFMGTDTLAGILYARKFYAEKMAGFSIPASEHSTITSWGEANEVKAFENMLDTYPTGLVACVSDSFDIIHATRNLWGGELKEKILARDGTLVVRPDSGEPVETVLAVLRELGKAFGYSVNGKGYKVLPPQIRMIQGDGIDFETLGEIVKAINEEGWSTDNIAFGSGGGLLQKLNRDTLKCAFKCSHIVGEDFERDVYKSPIGMPSKRSKRGRLKLVKVNGEFMTVNQNDPQYKEYEDYLKPVFENGEILRVSTFAEVRERAAV